jgi:hypothetical protein
MPAQFTKGFTFTPNDNVTNTELHDLVDNGSLRPGAITEQTLQTANLTTADVVLFNDVSAGTPGIGALTQLQLAKLWAEPFEIGQTNKVTANFALVSSPVAQFTSASIANLTGASSITGSAPSIAKAWVSFDGSLSTQTTSSATFSLTTITANFSSSHGLNTGDSIYITGQTGNNTPLNGTWAVTVTSGTQFTFVVGSTPAGTLSNFSVTKVAIRAAFNVSSVARIATGRYRINFTTPFADANYAIGMSFEYAQSGTTNVASGIATPNITSSSCEILSEFSNGTDVNQGFISMIFFR